MKAHEIEDFIVAFERDFPDWVVSRYCRYFILDVGWVLVQPRGDATAPEMMIRGAEDYREFVRQVKGAPG